MKYSLVILGFILLFISELTMYKYYIELLIAFTLFWAYFRQGKNRMFKLGQKFALLWGILILLMLVLVELDVYYMDDRFFSVWVSTKNFSFYVKILAIVYGAAGIWEEARLRHHEGIKSFSIKVILAYMIITVITHAVPSFVAAYHTPVTIVVITVKLLLITIPIIGSVQFRDKIETI